MTTKTPSTTNKPSATLAYETNRGCLALSIMLLMLLAIAIVTIIMFGNHDQ